MRSPLFIATFTLLAACKAGPSTEAGTKDAAGAALRLSLNDVSVLFPFNRQGAVKAAPNASDRPDPASLAGSPAAAPLDNQSFVPQPFLAQLDQELQKDAALRQKEDLPAWQQLDGGAATDAALFRDTVLQATAVRLDPCANALAIHGDVSLCEAQLKVLWQSGGADLNVRAVYHLESVDLHEAALTMVGLAAGAKFDYSAEPLQVHPVIARQGVAGSYYQGVVGLLHRYARASRLVALSGLVNTAPNDPHSLFSWAMLELSFQGGQPTGRPLVAVALNPGDTAKVVQRQPGRATPELRDSAGSQVNSLGLPSPLGTTVDTLFPRGELVTPPGAAISAHLADLESPLKQGQDSVDCATCHRALTIRKQLKVDADATAAYKSARWNLRNTTSLDALPYTALQMFSYRGDQLTGSAPFLPVISQRVINETAFATDFINDRVLHQLRPSP